MADYKVKLMPRAYRELEEIYNHIVDEFNEVSTAENMADLLEEAILSLETMPYRGSVRKVGIYANKR